MAHKRDFTMFRWAGKSRKSSSLIILNNKWCSRSLVKASYCWLQVNYDMLFWTSFHPALYIKTPLLLPQSNLKHTLSEDFTQFGNTIKVFPDCIEPSDKVFRCFLEENYNNSSSWLTFRCALVIRMLFDILLVRLVGNMMIMTCSIAWSS